jgi:hypothetical protein
MRYVARGLDTVLWREKQQSTQSTGGSEVIWECPIVDMVLRIRTAAWWGGSAIWFDSMDF